MTILALKDIVASLNHAIAQLEPTQASALSGNDADTATALAQVRIRELEGQVVEYRAECAKLLMAKSSLDREVGALIGERDELQRQLDQAREDARAAADQAMSNLRAIVSLNDDPHVDEIANVTADLLGQHLARVSSDQSNLTTASDEETRDYKRQWEDTYNKLIAMERTANRMADERAHVATELLSLQRLGVALCRALHGGDNNITPDTAAALRALAWALGEPLAPRG